MLGNEKYKGDALLQKSFTVDFLTKTMKPNRGELPSYYVKESHPAIISADEFDMVQAEIERRSQQGRGYGTRQQYLFIEAVLRRLRGALRRQGLAFQ